MLQTFLKNNLITLTDDTQLEKLKKSAGELVKLIKKDKARIYSFTLAAIDPNIPADNNEITEVVKIFEAKWPTYTSVTRDTPIPFVRGVILYALEELAADLGIANLIYLSAKNIVHYLNFTSIEEDTIQIFLMNVSEKVTKAADDKFKILHKINNIVTVEGLKRPFIEESTVSKTLTADFGDGTVQTFIPKVVKSYTSAVNRVHTDLSTNIDTVSSAINALGLKTELIWWKTSAYSPLLKKPYKDLQFPVKDISLAADYAQLIPVIFPESVNYFLLSTHQEITESDDETTLSNFFDDVKASASALTPFILDRVVPDGRISLLDFLSAIIYNKLSTADLKAKVGLSPSLSLKRKALTAWLFNDMLCQKILK